MENRTASFVQSPPQFCHISCRRRYISSFPCALQPLEVFLSAADRSQITKQSFKQRTCSLQTLLLTAIVFASRSSFQHILQLFSSLARSGRQRQQRHCVPLVSILVAASDLDNFFCDGLYLRISRNYSPLVDSPWHPCASFLRHSVPDTGVFPDTRIQAFSRIQA